MGSMGVPNDTAGVFEAIRHSDEAGGEFWSARELAQALGYTRWEQFPGVLSKAMEACESSGNLAPDHFRGSPKMVPIGSKAVRKLDDWQLSRYACYLIVQNADPSKPVVALGQTYFAVQTRRMELTDAAAADSLAGLTEAQRRLVNRQELAEQNTTLASAAQAAGVVTQRDFAVFQDHGYKGLYGGKTARDIADRKGLKRGQRILDWMGSEELADNRFRAAQTEAKLRREAITGREAANRAHHEVGRIVRKVIIEDLGGTPPEDLPTPTESIAQLQARERKAIEQERQPALFELDAAGDGEK